MQYKILDFLCIPCGLAQEMRVEPKDLFTSEKAVWLRGVPVIKGETEASEASTGIEWSVFQCAYVSFLR